MEEGDGLLLEGCSWWTIVGVVVDEHVGGDDGVVGCVGMDFEAGHDDLVLANICEMMMVI